jgi:hypothetical protein
MFDVVSLCPVCEFNCLRPYKVVVTCGFVRTIIDAGGTKVEQGTSKFPGSGRGAKIETFYVGECFHQWVEWRQFHKGECLVGTEILESATEETFPEVIWRD